MSTTYQDFLASKRALDRDTGLKKIPDLNPMLFDFQRDIVSWALRRGRAAIWADCGLGKTPMQLEWAKHVPGNVLILAPLAVSQQTVREGEKFRIEVKYCRDQSAVDSKITITNYEMLDHFTPDKFNAIVLDESSIIKNYAGKFRNKIIESFCNTPFRLACTATPAPNDYMELANHAEFLGTMTRSEMLAMFFVHDGGETSKWRLKGHAQGDFWKWICSWSVMLRKPSDLLYEDDGFLLPPIEFHEHIIDVDHTDATEGALFRMPAASLMERRQERARTTRDRCQFAADMVNKIDKPFLVWCDLNRESDMLTKMIPDGKQIKGSDSIEYKEKTILEFTNGELRVLITKPSIAGHGMNWQHCANMAFVGLSDSWEQFYQATRRCWRFGQKNTVHCNVIIAETEGAVLSNIQRKEHDAERMIIEMLKHMQVNNTADIHGIKRTTAQYNAGQKMIIPNWLRQEVA